MARRATVSVWDRSKGRDGHRGQGLLISVDGEGFVVLTCHHVIAPLRAENLCVRIIGTDGELEEPLPARCDAERSRPERDTAVLRLDGVATEERPLLHRLGLDYYDGALRATVLTHLRPDNFDAVVRASTRLEVDAAPSEAWPVVTGRYDLRAFRLSDPSDARPGVSGGVVVCEGGVLGLVHFARAEGSAHAREGFMIPLSVWAEGWPALERLIEPLVDENLRGAAVVKRASELSVGTDLVVARYREDVHIERQIEQRALTALAQGGVVIVGRPKSGKTRLVVDLLRQHSDTLVVIPYPGAPPPDRFEVSGLDSIDVFVVFDDLHATAATTQPLRWQRRLQEAAGGSCWLVCTTRDGREWNAVKDMQDTLLELIGKDGVVYASRTDEPGTAAGEDLSVEQGRELASKLGIAEQEFEARFDGIPGSLLLDLGDMGRRYEALRSEYVGGIPGSRLLDAAKLLHKGSQARLPDLTLRAVAEQVRGDGPMSDDVWESLRRNTQREGFGRFDGDGNFQIYRPYLEQCVPYDPSEEDMDRLGTLLAEKGDVAGLLQFAFSQEPDLDDGTKRLETIDTVLRLQPELSLGWFAKAIALNNLGRREEALEAYEGALRLEPDWPELWVGKGMILNELTRHEEALEDFEHSLSLAPELPEGWLGKGVSLSALGRSPEAISAYDRAIELRTDYPSAWQNKAMELAALGRHGEAMQHYDIALVFKPDYGLAHYNKGSQLLRASEYEEALNSYERALRYGSGYPHEDWSGKGVALTRLSRYEEAIDAFDQALKLNPYYIEAWHGKGVALDESGSHEDALVSFERGIGPNPDSPILLHSRGVTLIKLGRPEEALASFDEALVLEQPESTDTLINKAAVLSYLGRNSEALSVVNRAINAEPRVSDYWYLKADILSEMGRHEEAQFANSRAVYLAMQQSS